MQNGFVPQFMSQRTAIVVGQKCDEFNKLLSKSLQAREDDVKRAVSTSSRALLPVEYKNDQTLTNHSNSIVNQVPSDPIASRINTSSRSSAQDASVGEDLKTDGTPGTLSKYQLLKLQKKGLSVPQASYRQQNDGKKEDDFSLAVRLQLEEQKQEAEVKRQHEELCKNGGRVPQVVHQGPGGGQTTARASSDQYQGDVRLRYKETDLSDLQVNMKPRAASDTSSIQVKVKFCSDCGESADRGKFCQVKVVEESERKRGELQRGSGDRRGDDLF